MFDDKPFQHSAPVWQTDIQTYRIAIAYIALAQRRALKNSRFYLPTNVHGNGPVNVL